MPLPQALAPAWSGLRTSPPEVKTAYRHPGGFGCWSNCLARSLLVFVVVDLFAVLVQLLIEVGLLLLRQMAAVGRHVFLLFLRIGENTQGVFSDVLGRSLPNGWQFGLPNEVFRTEQGTTFDGPGIPPDIIVPVFADDDIAAGKDPAMAKALETLERKE